ncbi:MAG: hypothetical protein DCF31_02320 [Alphaproteobacteria bacterium]|nr:MAG: hypothetical protein DCF31_02320 [Alphaproteobacteria bacterium]
MSFAPDIPLDVKQTLKRCMLALFWPKKDIVEFLRSVECPESILSSLVIAGPEASSRRDIITEVISALGKRPDRGHATYQLMVDRLSNWTHFDRYWFEEQKKLDREEADLAIASLRNSVTLRNTRTARQRETSAKTKFAAAKTADLSALKTAFAKVHGAEMSPQARGKLFERFLKELFDRQSIKMGDPFEIVGEQIDGSFKFEGENYIVEAKWQDPSTSTGDLYKFAHKVDGKMHGRGLFVSVNGYSKDSLSAILHGKHIKTILVDGEDLVHILEGLLTLEDTLDFKIRSAQTRGDVYVCALRKAPKA